MLGGCTVGKVTRQQYHPKSEVITPRSAGRLVSGAAAGEAMLAAGVLIFYPIMT